MLPLSRVSPRCIFVCTIFCVECGSFVGTIAVRTLVLFDSAGAESLQGVEQLKAPGLLFTSSEIDMHMWVQDIGASTLNVNVKLKKDSEADKQLATFVNQVPAALGQGGLLKKLESYRVTGLDFTMGYSFYQAKDPLNLEYMHVVGSNAAPIKEMLLDLPFGQFKYSISFSLVGFTAHVYDGIGASSADVVIEVVTSEAKFGRTIPAIVKQHLQDPINLRIAPDRLICDDTVAPTYKGRVIDVGVKGSPHLMICATDAASASALKRRGLSKLIELSVTAADDGVNINCGDFVLFQVHKGGVQVPQTKPGNAAFQDKAGCKKPPSEMCA